MDGYGYTPIPPAEASCIIAHLFVELAPPCSTKALTSQKHFFTNQTKTAASWGVKIKVKLLRGSAEGDCYIQSVGGNFA